MALFQNLSNKVNSGLAVLASGPLWSPLPSGVTARDRWSSGSGRVFGRGFKTVKDQDCPDLTLPRGYKPVGLKLTESPAFTMRPAEYPPPKTLFLPAVQEEIPIYLEKIHISEDLALRRRPRHQIPRGALSSAAVSVTRLVMTRCVTFQKSASEWVVEIAERDVQGVPESLQRERKK